MGKDVNLYISQTHLPTLGIKGATQMAEVYGMKSPQSFNKLLAKCGILVDTANGYVLADSLKGKGYVAVIEVPYWLPCGVKATKKKPVWTESGQQYIHSILLHHGITPVCERKSLFD